MESLKFSRNVTDINDVLNDCVNCSTRCQYISNIQQNSDWLVENCSGDIDSTLFQSLIKETRKNPALLEVLFQTIDYANESDISDDIFNMIVSLPIEYKDYLVVSLSHKSLSEQQLLFLCNYGLTFEPYYELAIKYYIDDFFAFDRLNRLLSKFKNGQYGYLYEDLLLELSSYKTSCRKKEKFLLNELIKAKNTGNNTWDG